MAASTKWGNLPTAIAQFRNDDLFTSSLRLFEILGYNTSRRFRLSENTFRGFKNEFLTNGQRFNEDKALVRDWQKIELLFQLSSEEMQQAEAEFGKKKIDRSSPASYLFFAIELQGKHPRRSQLANIAREINKIFPMHVFLLVKHGNQLSLALIDRRPHKLDAQRDVLEKVTNLYCISIEKPHPGHLQILHSLSLESLRAEAPKKKLETFADLQYGWRKVLSTQVLNRQFYLDYQTLSRGIIQRIHPRQVVGKAQAHQGVLNLLNRIMFIYFVQKKKWLMGDENFLFHFWQAYNREARQQQPGAFHRDWLNPIFFSAFNGKAKSNRQAFVALTPEYKSVISSFCWLNGGLYTEDPELDSFLLPDDAFDEIFAFFESYIFTITENTAYDLNLEIEPSLLGKMYESMINARDMNDVEAHKGIVYTEPAEINFMARRSFVEVLWRKKDLPEFEGIKNLSREFLYHFVFDAGEQKKDWLRRTKVDAAILRRAVCAITACDPACGSGSMLLGVLQLQMELLKALDEFEGKRHSHKRAFELKKQLISECLYGVDVKEWAVRIAELRLWLYMIEEAEFSQEELTEAPLLPNLDFKLRCGNSLISKIGEQDFSLSALRSKKNTHSAAVARLLAFIAKKKQFIVNKAPESTFKKLKAEEGEVFKAFIKQRIAELERELKSASKNIVQTALFDVEEKDLFAESRAALAKEIEALKSLSKDIERRKNLPFSYELDFMEIFLANDEPGFDLIIGNPPYVRQEDFLPPDDEEYLQELLEKGSKEEKAQANKLLKAALNNKVFETYPFLKTSLRTVIEGKNKTVSVYGDKVPGRSDLYVYFQLLCPKYLNSNGIFCFIISNSWLDVEYGAFVQHFLLKHTQLLAVYDCNVRSFNASVNTVIYLHSAPVNADAFKPESFYKTLEPPDQPVRFVMNKIDYSLAADTDWLIEQEKAEQNTFRTSYRIITQSQKSLYRAGYNDEEKRYAGDKWGGKYLRAPEIYYTILEKGREHISCFGEYFQGERYLNTGGADDFFLITDFTDRGDHYWIRNNKTISGCSDFSGKIERRYLCPIIKDITKTDKAIAIQRADALCLVVVDQPSKLVEQYVKWGEMNGYHKRSVTKLQKPWYKPTRQMLHSGEVLLPRSFNNIFVVHHNPLKFLSLRYYRLHPIQGGTVQLVSFLNSTPFWLIFETLGNKNLGQGALDFFMSSFLRMRVPIILDRRMEAAYSRLTKREIGSIFTECGFKFDTTVPIRNQPPNPLPDRKALDDIIFDELGLARAERNEVYWSVAELVQQRLDKAATR